MKSLTFIFLVLCCFSTTAVANTHNPIHAPKLTNKKVKGELAFNIGNKIYYSNDTAYVLGATTPTNTKFVTKQEQVTLIPVGKSVITIKEITPNITKPNSSGIWISDDECSGKTLKPGDYCNIQLNYLGDDSKGNTTPVTTKQNIMVNTDQGKFKLKAAGLWPLAPLQIDEVQGYIQTQDHPEHQNISLSNIDLPLHRLAPIELTGLTNGHMANGIVGPLPSGLSITDFPTPGTVLQANDKETFVFNYTPTSGVYTPNGISGQKVITYEQTDPLQNNTVLKKELSFPAQAFNLMVQSIPYNQQYLQETNETSGGTQIQVIQDNPKIILLLNDSAAPKISFDGGVHYHLINQAGLYKNLCLYDIHVTGFKPGDKIYFTYNSSALITFGHLVYSVIKADGTIGAWHTISAKDMGFPSEKGFIMSLFVTGNNPGDRIYVSALLGGIAYTTLKQDGSFDKWTVISNKQIGFDDDFYNQQIFVTGNNPGDYILVGGHTLKDNDPLFPDIKFNGIAYTTIQPNGNPGEWIIQNISDYNRSGSIYMTGNKPGSKVFTVHYASSNGGLLMSHIQQDGKLAPWSLISPNTDVNGSIHSIKIVGEFPNKLLLLGESHDTALVYTTLDQDNNPTTWNAVTFADYFPNIFGIRGITGTGGLPGDKVYISTLLGTLFAKINQNHKVDPDWGDLEIPLNGSIRQIITTGNKPGAMIFVPLFASEKNKDTDVNTGGGFAYSTIKEGGEPGPWTTINKETTPEYPNSNGTNSIYITGDTVNSYVYVGTASYGANNSLAYTQIESEGKLGQWTAVDALKNKRITRIFVAQHRFYVSTDTNEIYYTDIDDKGLIADNWKQSVLPQGEQIGDVFATGNNPGDILFAVSYENIERINYFRCYYSVIGSNGDLGEWQKIDIQNPLFDEKQNMLNIYATGFHKGDIAYIATDKGLLYSKFIEDDQFGPWQLKNDFLAAYLPSTSWAAVNGVYASGSLPGDRVYLSLVGKLPVYDQPFGLLQVDAGVNAIAYSTIQANGAFGVWHILETNVADASFSNYIHPLAVTGNAKDDFLYFIGSWMGTGLSRIPLSSLKE
jgi:hypothetical protein